MGKRRRWRKCARSMVSGILSVILAVVFCIGDISFTKSQGVLAAEGGKIDVWDFGAVEETDSQLYANHITQEDWNTCENVSDKGTFTAGTTTFGDLTITHNANDRLYSASTKNYGTSGLASTAYEDGYVAAGMYYCNGTGGPTRRYLSIEHVEAGDKINVYMAASNSASDNVCFLYIGDDGTQEDQQVFSNQPSKITFVAKYSGTYKIYTTTDGSAKPCFNRVERVPGVQVKGTVSKNKCDISDYHVLFTNNTTGVTTEAVLDGEQYTVVLEYGDRIWIYECNQAGNSGRN